MILLDAMMQCYRANSKLMELVTRDGRHTGMEYGFLKSLEALRRYFKDEIIICWEGRNNFRLKIDPEYKANRREKRKRDTHQFLTHDRIGKFQQFISMIAETAQHDELEADDVIATLTERYCKTEKVVIYSGDKDLLQLVRRKPFPVVQVKAYQFRETPWNVGRISLEYHGLSPNQLAIYLAFVGDTSDNIKGAFRVRSTLVGSAIREGYQPCNMSDYELFSAKEICSLDEHFKSGKFDHNLKLVTLKIKDDIGVIPRNWQQEKIADWLNNMEFRTLDICKQCGLEFSTTIKESDEF